jgi:hypothetical protein
MGLFDKIRAFLQDAQKLGEFSRLKQELAAPTNSSRSAGVVLDEFTSLLISRVGIADVLQIHGYEGDAGKEKLSGLYLIMIANGAGQWIGKTHVATAVLYDPELLEVILQLEDKDVSGSEMAFAAIEYIEGKAQE